MTSIPNYSSNQENTRPHKKFSVEVEKGRNEHEGNNKRSVDAMVRLKWCGEEDEELYEE